MFGQGEAEGNQQQPPQSNPKEQQQWMPSAELHQTAAKRQEQNPFYSQITPKPQRKILLYGENNARFLFPLLKDRDIGIEPAYQNVVIESHNDDDRQTTSTQLHRGMAQTMDDLYEVLSKSHSKSSSASSYSFYTQLPQ